MGYKISGFQELHLPALIILALWVYPTPITPYFPQDQCSQWSDLIPESQIAKHLKITIVDQAKLIAHIYTSSE